MQFFLKPMIMLITLISIISSSFLSDASDEPDDISMEVSKNYYWKKKDGDAVFVNIDAATDFFSEFFELYGFESFQKLFMYSFACGDEQKKADYVAKTLENPNENITRKGVLDTLSQHFRCEFDKLKEEADAQHKQFTIQEQQKKLLKIFKVCLDSMKARKTPHYASALTRFEELLDNQIEKILISIRYNSICQYFTVTLNGEDRAVNSDQIESFVNMLYQPDFFYEKSGVLDQKLSSFNTIETPSLLARQTKISTTFSSMSTEENCSIEKEKEKEKEKEERGEDEELIKTCQVTLDGLVEFILLIAQENPRQSLMRLINQNDGDAYLEIKSLIEKGVSVESDEEFSPILNAATRSNNKIFELILEQNPTPQNAYLDTALAAVCRDKCIERKIERLDQLLKKGWRFDKFSETRSETPLVALIKERRDLSFVFENFYEKIEGKRLLNMDAEFFQTLVFFGDANMVKHIINHEDFKPEVSSHTYGCNINALIEINRFDIACELLKKCPDNAIKAQALFNCMSLSSRVKMQDYKNIIIALQVRQVNINESYSLCGLAPLAPIHSAISNLNIPYLQALLECHADCSVLSDGLNLLQFTTNLLDDSSNDFASVIKILALLKKYLDESKFDESSKDQLSARAKISQHEKVDDILKELNM